MYKENIYFKRSKSEVAVSILGSKWFWFGLWAVVTVLSLTANYMSVKAKYNLKCSVGGYFTTKEQCHKMAHPKPDLTLVPVESVLHKFQNIQVIKKAQASEVEPSVQEIVRKMYQLESSSGKNDSCRAKGKYNGYGYAQSIHTWNCYESHEQVKELVTAWVIDKQNKGYTLNELLCYYNIGIKTNTCLYVNKFNSIK